MITAESVLAEHDDDIFYCGDTEHPLDGVPSLVFTCVRPEKHKGDHAAVVDGVLVATWGQRPTTKAAEEKPAKPDPRMGHYTAGALRITELDPSRVRATRYEIARAVLDPVLDLLDEVRSRARKNGDLLNRAEADLRDISGQTATHIARAEETVTRAQAEATHYARALDASRNEVSRLRAGFADVEAAVRYATE